MEIDRKIHVEQPAPHGVHRQHSAKCDRQTNKQTDKTSGYATMVHGQGCSPSLYNNFHKPGNYVIMTSLMTS